MDIDWSKMKVNHLVKKTMKQHNDLNKYLLGKCPASDYTYKDQNDDMKNIKEEFNDIIKLIQYVSAKMKNIKSKINLTEIDSHLNEILEMLIEKKCKLHGVNYKSKIMNKKHFNKIVEKENATKKDNFELDAFNILRDKHMETIKEIFQNMNVKTKHGTSLNDLLKSCDNLYDEFRKLDENRNKSKTEWAVKVLELNKLEDVIVKIKKDCKFMKNLYKDINQLSEEEALILDKKYEKTKQEYQKMNNKLKVLKKRLSFYEKNGDTDYSTKPPTGYISVIFTDIENSTTLWEKDSNLMLNVIKKHNNIIRNLLKKYKGYEVKTDGDSFMCVFEDLKKCIQFAIKIQLELMNVNWPEKLLEIPEVKKVYYGDKLIFNGIRIRIGINSGNTISEIDPTTGRMDYFGPIVNKASRIENKAEGGQIIISEDIKKNLDTYEDIKNNVIINKIKNQSFRGIRGSENIYVIYPKELENRNKYFLPKISRKNTNTKLKSTKLKKIYKPKKKKKLKRIKRTELSNLAMKRIFKKRLPSIYQK
jgi:class 3 adenylate cyclase